MEVERRPTEPAFLLSWALQPSQLLLEYAEGPLLTPWGADLFSHVLPILLAYKSMRYKWLMF